MHGKDHHSQGMLGKLHTLVHPVHALAFGFSYALNQGSGTTAAHPR
jgi:hypothetical protein